jgi:hypothetical protein
MRVCHRLGGSNTWESDERIRGGTGISFFNRGHFGNRSIVVKVSAVSPRATKLYDRTGDEITLDEAKWSGELRR